jgi:hypothetical protein
LALLLASTLGAPIANAGTSSAGDITNTPIGKQKIRVTASSFAAQGAPTAEQDLVATQLEDGAILVLRKGFDITAAADGYRVTTPGDSLASPLDAVDAVAAGAYWSIISTNCFAALFRGAAHMDTCYRHYKMVSDGDGSKDYWRLDLYGTMFAEGRTLDWGWVAADRDAGPALNFVDWSPDVDVEQACASFGLSISVVGVGGGFSSTFCELNDISKSAGATVGWFKDRWSWGTKWTPTRDRDRKAAIEIGASSSQGAGTPVWGLSWDFAAH